MPPCGLPGWVGESRRAARRTRPCHRVDVLRHARGRDATDPLAYGRPTGGQAYVDEIRKVTDKPIRYVVYSRRLMLGGTTVELTHHGLNRSDSTLVMRLPKERIVFVVDTIPVGQVPGRGMVDFHPP